MSRLRFDDFEASERALTLERCGDRRAGQVAGLLIACSAECFPSEALALELLPDAWLVHRTPGNIVPPYGAGHHVEEELLARAVNELRVDTVVVCGHYSCPITAHLLADDEPADDFVLRDWLSHAEAARHVVSGYRGTDRACVAATCNVLTQMANLRTHPAVAAALAHNRLRLWGWLHAGELLYASPGQTSFDRPVALHPDQNRLLRRERVSQRRRPAPHRADAPYLA